jgi:hypothetical protein
MYLKVSLCILVGCLLLINPLANYAQLPTNNNPQNQIRFKTLKGAEERRNELIQFIWKNKLPTDMLPNVIEDVTKEALNFRLKQVNKKRVKSIDKLEVEILGFTSTAYLIVPIKSLVIPQLVLLQAGHGPLEDACLKKKYCSTIDFFLNKGYNIIMLNMPMNGWNDDDTAVLPNGKKVTVSSTTDKAHNNIIRLSDLDAPMEKGIGFRPFLEPVVACINYWNQHCDVNPDITMIGLSGGGWTTHLLAAIDTRIKLSFPIAGSYPLYLRNGEENKAHLGDLEQYYEPLYNEDIASDGTGGGIATWLEIYALGGIGKGRKQIMITSQYDDCCFFGDPVKTVNTFKSVVKGKVEELGVGAWKHELDTTHREHTISPWMLENVVKPNLSFIN